MLTDVQTDIRRRAYALASEIGITREERHSLAEFLLKRDVDSWKGLSDNELRRVVDAFVGWDMVNHVLLQRP